MRRWCWVDWLILTVTVAAFGYVVGALVVCFADRALHTEPPPAEVHTR